MTSLDRDMAIQAAQAAAQAMTRETEAAPPQNNSIPPEQRHSQPSMSPQGVAIPAPTLLPVFPSMDAAAAAVAVQSLAPTLPRTVRHTVGRPVSQQQHNGVPKPRVQGRRRQLVDIDESNEKVVKLQRRMVGYVCM